MASLRVSRFRPLLVLAFFLAAWWLAPVAVRSFSRTSFSLFEAPGWFGYSHLKDLQDFWSLENHRKASLIEAGRDAARQAGYLGLQLQQSESLRDENQRLEAALQMPPEPGFRYEFARVIYRGESTWWQQLLIRKGRRDGIAPGQGVVFSGGVVGRITVADEYTAVVELASSPSFRVAATLGLDTTDPVIYQGVEPKPFQPPTGEVSGVPPHSVLMGAQPVRLVTSSLGGVFPQGLTLGEVDHLEPGSDGLFQAGIVKLDPLLLSLHEVAVLVPENPSSNPPPPQPATSAATTHQPVNNR